MNNNSHPQVPSSSSANIFNVEWEREKERNSPPLRKNWIFSLWITWWDLTRCYLKFFLFCKLHFNFLYSIFPPSLWSLECVCWHIERHGQTYKRGSQTTQHGMMMIMMRKIWDEYGCCKEMRDGKKGKNLAFEKKIQFSRVPFQMRKKKIKFIIAHFWFHSFLQC